MSKDRTLELFTLKALASEEKISYSHMKRLMMEIVKTEPLEWQGWRFLRIGTKPKIVWLAYRGKQNIVIHNEPKGEESRGSEPANEEEKPDAETPTVDASDAEAPSPAPQ